jgi:signal transduction histidine kinase
VSADPALRAANVGAWRTLAIGSVSAIVLAVGVVLMARVARARVQLSELRSEFVSTVTHELKTPLASIQAVAETFASDRGMTPELSRKYGRLTLQEVKRLRRQVDNLLAYGRMNDVDEFYSFEEVSPHDIVERVLKDFAAQLEHLKFETSVDVPPTLPDVRADDKAMQLVFGNLIDNVVRYSAGIRVLRVRAFQDGDAVVFEVSDRGVGIAEEDLPHVTRRFFRGRSTEVSGSGLGLAIVERMVNSHGGSLRVRSTVGSGTTVSVGMPIARTR